HTPDSRPLHSFPTRRSSDLPSSNCLRRGRSPAWPNGPSRAWNGSTSTPPRTWPAPPTSPPVKESSEPHRNPRHQRRPLPAREDRSEEYTSELQSRENLVCRL